MVGAQSRQRLPGCGIGDVRRATPPRAHAPPRHRSGAARARCAGRASVASASGIGYGTARSKSGRLSHATHRGWTCPEQSARRGAERRRPGPRQRDDTAQAGLIVLELEFAAVQPRDRRREAQAQPGARLRSGSVPGGRSAPPRGRDRLRQCPDRHRPPSAGSGRRRPAALHHDFRPGTPFGRAATARRT